MSIIKYRIATEDDGSDILAIGKSVGFHLANFLPEVFLKISDGITIIAEDESGKIIGFITCLNLSNELGMLNMFAVLKEFQGKGIGTELYKRAKHNFEDRNIAINSVKSMVDNYRTKEGFQLTASWKIIKYNITKIYNEEFNIPETILKSYNSKIIDDIAFYDYNVCKIVRKDILKIWLAKADLCIVVYKRNCIVGYGAIFKTDMLGSYGIQPLYADSYELSKLILINLINGENVKFNKVSILCDSKNENSMKLGKEFGQNDMELIRMYTKNEVDIYHEKVFSAITTISII